MCEPGRALIAEGLSLITQVILRKGESLYLNDGVYGSFDELNLPGWTAHYRHKVWSLDAGGRAVPVPGEDKPFRAFGPTCDTLDVLHRPLMLPDSIEGGHYIVFEDMAAYSVSLRTTFNGFYPDTWAVVGN
jgi:ornithine decarboxylase